MSASTQSATEVRRAAYLLDDVLAARHLERGARHRPRGSGRSASSRGSGGSAMPVLLVGSSFAHPPPQLAAQVEKRSRPDLSVLRAASATLTPTTCCLAVTRKSYGEAPTPITSRWMTAWSRSYRWRGPPESGRPACPCQNRPAVRRTTSRDAERGSFCRVHRAPRPRRDCPSAQSIGPLPARLCGLDPCSRDDLPRVVLNAPALKSP